MKKSDKDSKDKESLSPKNAQNAHEAIRPAETDGKVRTDMCVCVYARLCVCECVCV